jgi:flagellar motility protein MotE (MotC chaperone)
VVRIAGGTGPAVARELSALPQGISRDQAGGADLENCSPEARILPVLETLKQRAAELDERETELESRFQTLKLAEEEIQYNLAALISAEDALEATIALADGAADADIGRLTEVYEKMNPKDAAALFEEMDPTFSAGFLSRMRPESAAAIMAGLTPTSAYTISIVLAGRNTNVPRD